MSIGVFTIRDRLYRILEFPAVYRLAQALLAFGAERFFENYFDALELQHDPRPWLDIGCGPDSYVPCPAGGLIALDLNPSYVSATNGRGTLGVVGNATHLPFCDDFFGAVWSIGLLHHLPDLTARAALEEMLRVSGSNGRVFVFDAVLPEPWWRRPHAYAIRRLDRGRHMRTEAELLEILPDTADWKIERHTHTLNGLEVLLCIAQQPTPRES